MSKHKRKIIYNKELAEKNRLPIRIPTTKAGQTFKDKTKYTRKIKHKNSE